MKLNTKVLVVGGGPAGATAGRLLAESGKDIILLEKNLSYAKPCGGGIALNAFDEFSLSKTLIKWKGRFQKRFILLDKLDAYFLKDDKSAEKLIALHRRPEVQEASLLLWLRKDNSRQSLMHYLKLFGKFLH